MTTATLEVVQRLIDQLTPLEQARLLEYLTPRIVRAMATRQAVQAANGAPIAEAWQTFFSVGDQVAATDRPDLPTLTETVQQMRR
jgi:hypothetical protein